MSWDEMAKTALSLAGSLRATVAVVFGLCLLLLFVNQVPASLGLDGLLQQYRPWIGGVLLVSGSICAVHLLRSVRGWWRNRRARGSRIKALYALAHDEQAVLALFLAMNRKTVMLPIDKGCAGNLANMGIIYQSASVGSLLGGFPFSMQPWAWEHLHDHPECVGLSQDSSKWADEVREYREVLRDQMPEWQD